MGPVNLVCNDNVPTILDLRTDDMAMVRIKTYNLADVGCILFKNAEAITLPVSLSRI